jgi:hypothetical protein
MHGVQPGHCLTLCQRRQGGRKYSAGTHRAGWFLTALGLDSLKARPPLAVVIEGIQRILPSLDYGLFVGLEVGGRPGGMMGT